MSRTDKRAGMVHSVKKNQTLHPEKGYEHVVRSGCYIEAEADLVRLVVLDAERACYPDVPPTADELNNVPQRAYDGRSFQPTRRETEVEQRVVISLRGYLGGKFCHSVCISPPLRRNKIRERDRRKLRRRSEVVIVQAKKLGILYSIDL